MIEKYKKFKEDLLLEKVINESIIYFSPKFRDRLGKIDSPVADELLKKEGEDLKQDITFIDIDDKKDGYITFTTMSNAWKKLEPKYGNLNIRKEPSISITDRLYTRDIEGIYSKSRNPMKIGRFVNKLLKKSKKEVDKFIDQFKASVENSKEKMLVVKGDDIAKWYRYEKYKSQTGELGSSCMRDMSSNTFEMYTSNDVCSMVILVEDDLLKGRALLWELSEISDNFANVEGPIYFMDRKYTNEQSDIQKFVDYAKKEGWYYRTNNNCCDTINASFGDVSKSVDMEVTLNSTYDNYPYMDTFKRFDPHESILHNDTELGYEHYILEDTNGGFNDETGQWSDWHDEIIPEDDAVYSDAVNSFIWADRSVYVEHGTNQGVYPDGYEDVVYDEYSDIDIHINDAVYSENYGYYIFDETAVKVINDIEADGDSGIDEEDWYNEDDDEIISTTYFDYMTWCEKLVSENNFDEYNYVLRSLLIKNSQSEWIPKIFEISIYEVTTNSGSVDITGVYHLSKIDALILGYDIDSEKEEVIIDKYEYNYDISDILHLIVDRGNNVLNDKGQLSIKFEDEDSRILSENRDQIEMRIEEIENEQFYDYIPSKAE